MEESQPEEKTNEENKNIGLFGGPKVPEKPKTTEELIADTNKKVNIILFIIVAEIVIGFLVYQNAVNSI